MRQDWTIPAHVPQELVRDFNYIDQPDSQDDPHGSWKNLHDEGAGIIWSPYLGGHWMIVRNAPLKDALNNHELFSSTQTSIPAHTLVSAPIQFDPPDHTRLKALGVPSFSPQALANVEEEIRTLAHSLIDQFDDKGECDFISDYALQVPIITFMRLAGLPLEDREMLLELVEVQIRGTEVAERQAAQKALQDYAERIGRERIADPSGNDMVSQLCRGDGKGNFATDEEIVGYVLLLLGAGLDTVSSSMGFMMRFLAENSGHRRQVCENPRLIRNAIEEMLRRFGVSAPARVLTRDTVFHGVDMRAGDAVLLVLTLGGLDERAFPDPLTVDFERKDAAHSLVFGGGIHRCIGSFLARLELRVGLSVWLERIPEFRIHSERKPVGLASLVNTMQSLNLQWEPENVAAL